MQQLPQHRVTPEAPTAKRLERRATRAGLKIAAEQPPGEDRSDRADRVLRVAVIASSVLLGAYALELLLNPFGGALNEFFNVVVASVFIVIAALASAVRAIASQRNRAAWWTVTASLASWAIADIYWNAYIAKLDNPPYPSVADYLYLIFYPLMFVGMAMLARKSIAKPRASVWMHGLIAVLAAAAIDAALVFDTIQPTASGSPAEIATNLAYPFGDVLLLGFVLGVWALSGWRPPAMWRWIGAGLLLITLGDSIFLYRDATSAFEVGTWVDLTWPASALCLSVAAWKTSDRSAKFRSDADSWLFLPTAVFSLIALGILVWDHFNPVGVLALVLATTAAVATIAQMAFAFAENSRLLAASDLLASTDQVTGIPNRHQLMEDLEAACADATETRPAVLLMFDIDGFKGVNDTLGHVEGDHLLRMFADRLTELANPRGLAYRLGGDEFCILLRAHPDDLAELTEVARDSLTVHGDGYSVTSSFGAVSMPRDTRITEEALRIVDRRMYRDKAEGRLKRELA